MAPMTRNSTALLPGASRQAMREPSWQMIEPENRSERELSEEPTSSYDDEGDMRIEYRNEAEQPDIKPLPTPESSEDRDDILHPLREAANRVGREVERFAELLDGYNPLRATADEERYTMTIDLVRLYHGIALDTLKRLRSQHSAEKRQRDGGRRYDSYGLADDENEDIEDEEYPLPKSNTTLDDLERWEQEAQIWDLIERLVHLRFPAPDTAENNLRSAQKENQIHRYSSEREIWDKFLATDDLALERKTVLQWLKDTADESGEDIDVLVQDLQQNADRGDIIAHGWLHTKNAIKQQKRANWLGQSLDPNSLDVRRDHLNSTNTEPLVTQLDPDAPTRQGRKLEAEDEHFERAIWLGCYEMLRRGRTPSQIREWCLERTETWRAISISGFLDGHSDVDDSNSTGSASSILWRRMCFSLARRSKGDDFQRAVYGIVSGDISSVEPVCESWNDFIFVHFNALLRAQYDIYLRSIYPESTFATGNLNQGVFDAVQFHGDGNTAGRRLIETLKIDPRTQQETLQPMKMLQGVLIANQFDDFIYQQGLALAKFANANGASSLIPARDEQPENEDTTRYIALDDHDSLRVLTHVLLVFMALGMDLGGFAREIEVENVIVAYISFLRLAGKEELIPLYSSQLSGTRRYAVLSRNLIDVTDRDQRVLQIKLMRELGLDVQEFVKMQARYLLDDFEDTVEGYPATGNFTLFEDIQTETGTIHRVKKDFFGDDTAVVERVDMLLIRSLEWYLLVEGLWSETFTVGTILYLRFFKHMHLSAARMLASRVHSIDIARSKTRAIIGQSQDFNSLELDNDDELTEVLDGTANKKRQLKKFLLAEARSYRELELLTDHLDNIETVTSMAGLLNEESEVIWQKGWRQELARAFVPTRATSKPLQKGWLVTSQREEVAAEFQLLREAYLPETILAYISTLQFGGSALTRDFLMECMDLSAVIADEESDLLPLFVKTGRMEELVEAFASASKSLLLITSAKPGQASRSKKLRVKGWKHDIWGMRR